MNLRAILFGLVASLALVAPITASAQYSYPTDDRVRGGVISSVQGSSFTLANGMTIFMHPGTVINPTGADLTSGMAVRIVGKLNGDGTMNADEVDVRASSGTFYLPPTRSGWYDVNGNFHTGRPVGGFYDENGVFHPANRIVGGWYDVNGAWHPGAPTGFFFDPRDGQWHSY